MENIEITLEERNRLLEMSIKLFPEYPEIRFKKDYILLYNKETFDNIKNQLGEEFENILLQDEESDVKIHWLEFCLYYLVDKVFNEDKEESYMSNQDFYMGGLIYRNKSQNPIDILYETFKSNKL